MPQTNIPAQQQQQLQQQQLSSATIAHTGAATSPQHLLVAQQQQQQMQQQMTGGGVATVSGPISTTPDQIAKIQSELDIVTMNMSVLGEMLIEMKPGQEDPSDYRLMTELTHTCK